MKGFTILLLALGAISVAGVCVGIVIGVPVGWIVRGKVESKPERRTLPFKIE